MKPKIGKVQTAVMLDEESHRALKRLAVDRGTTLAQEFQRAADAYLASVDRTAKRQRPSTAV